MSAFLGVEKSLTGRRWIGLSPEAERLSEAMSQQSEIPDPVCRTMSRLGVTTEMAEAYMAPALRDLLPDPSNLLEMEKAAKRVLEAVFKSEKVAIFADYDVDGACSASLLMAWFKHLGLIPTLYVPDRIDEGYGPNVSAMELLAKDQDLIICVDCGTLSHEPVAAARGADVVILDHHLGGETLPPALAVVNPNRQDEDGSLGHLCAAGVVFLLLVALNRDLRNHNKVGPDLISLLDLVALATVADVAPLKGINRAFVRQGLKVMGQRARLGLRVLADVARIDTAPTAYHLGYVLGPRINAGGRIGAADLGARLLSTSDPERAGEIARRLDELNSERRNIETAVREEALAQAEARGLEAPLAWAAGDGWHPGVVGIVAARLKEAANRPAVVIGFDGNEGKGSARSVSGIDLGAQIQRLVSEGLLTKGGGHKMAAGLSLTREQLEPAMARLSDLMGKQGADRMGAADLRLDGTLMPSAATLELVEALEKAGPFGAGAAAPRFVFPSQTIRFTKPVGEGHLKLSFGNMGDPTLDAIAFNASASGLMQALQNHDGRAFHLAGRLEMNSWGGRQSVQLRLEDAAQAN